MAKQTKTKLKCVEHNERIRFICQEMTELKDLMKEHVKTSEAFRQTVAVHTNSFRWVWGALVLIFGTLSTIIYAMLK